MLNVTGAKSQWLTKVAVINVSSSGAYDSSTPPIELRSGDIDGDDSVTVFDYSILSDYFDKTSADSDWLSVGSNGFRPIDTDLDEVESGGLYDVSVFDYAILSAAFDQNGDKY